MKNSLLSFLNDYSGFNIKSCDGFYNKFLENKADLFKFFDNSLVKEKPINITFTKEDLEEDLINVFNCNLFNCLYKSFTTIRQFDHERLCHDFFSLEERYENKLSRNISLFYKTKELKFTKGIKLTKVISKMFALAQEEDDLDDKLLTFFINSYSRVLNKKCFDGILCVSIHPLDFLTMSENTHGWRSCFRVDGEYSASPRYLMQSKNIVMTYLKSTDSTINIGGERWNNKKWRAYAIVENGNVLLGKSYPAYYPSISKLSAEMVAETLNILGETVQVESFSDESDVCSTDHNRFYNDFCHSDFYTYMVKGNNNSHFNIDGSHLCIQCGNPTFEGSFCPSCYDDNNYKRCPICRERIYRGKKTCDFCGKLLEKGVKIADNEACYDLNECYNLTIFPEDGENYIMYIATSAYIMQIQSKDTPSKGSTFYCYASDLNPGWFKKFFPDGQEPERFIGGMREVRGGIGNSHNFELPF